MKKNRIISICNLKKNYHTIESEIKALENISFDINEKDFISIVGPSGCGKSTILSILSNLENKSSGLITNYKPIKVGYMLQNDCLFFWRTVLENCLIGLEITNSLNEDMIKYLEYCLEIES